MTTPTSNGVSHGARHGSPTADDAGANPEAFAPEQLAEVHQDAGRALDRVKAGAASDLSQAVYGIEPGPEAAR